jgi:hypothetical protein
MLKEESGFPADNFKTKTPNDEELPLFRKEKACKNYKESEGGTGHMGPVIAGANYTMHKSIGRWEPQPTTPRGRCRGIGNRGFIPSEESRGTEPVRTGVFGFGGSLGALG